MSLKSLITETVLIDSMYDIESELTDLRPVIAKDCFNLLSIPKISMAV